MDANALKIVVARVWGEGGRREGLSFFWLPLVLVEERKYEYENYPISNEWDFILLKIKTKITK